MLDQLKKYAALFILAAFIVVAVWGYLKYRSYEKQLADLRNQVAAKDKTVEELKNTYTKLAMENDDLKSSNSDLQKLLDKTKQSLIAEQQATVYWKGAYQYVLTHQPKPDDGGFKPPVNPTSCTAQPKTYTAGQDLGVIRVDVDTFTKDPDYQQKLTLSPGSKPLTLTLDLTRDRNLQWHTHVVSSDDRFGVDIGVNQVNLSPLEENFWDKIGVLVDVGASGSGLLGGFGLDYELGKFSVGPHVWGTTSNGGQYWLGASLRWTPFKANHF